jgi:LEA14-like dessication related protein
MNDVRQLSVMAAAVVLIAASLTLASCATPRVELNTARLDNITLSGLTVDVFLNVTNPNQFDLPLERVDWDLRLFDAHIGSGTSDMDRNLPAERTTRVKMPITVSFDGASSVATSLARKRSISWDLDGTAHFRAPTGPLSLDFDKGGRWDNPLR